MIVIFRGLVGGGAEMYEIYDFQVIYYSIKKTTHIIFTYPGQNISKLHFFITKCMNFHKIVQGFVLLNFYCNKNAIIANSQ